jgi:RNA polymerase sigma-70 factor, ECF subfamily
MMGVMGEAPDHAAALLELYDEAVDEVYRYLRARCGHRQLAEDLCADTFLAAVGQVQRRAVDEVTVAWLIGIARHKLIDHWRRMSRRPESPEHDVPDLPEVGDAWGEVIDRHEVESVLSALGPHHRSALVLRYFDGLPVPQVAEFLGRTEHATEALLVRARRRFRATYDLQYGGAR